LSFEGKTLKISTTFLSPLLGPREYNISYLINAFFCRSIEAERKIFAGWSNASKGSPF
jgi:hypothetical protein